jgi:AcrR family transcriptional regulator
VRVSLRIVRRWPPRYCRSRSPKVTGHDAPPIKLLSMARAARPPPLKPRKTPTHPRAERTVAAILEAAAQVLERDGLEGFNTNAVAERAGVSIGSLYQYFPGKDALTLALMNRENDRFLAEAVMALDQSSGAEALKSFVGACVRQQLVRPELARLLDVEQARPALRKEAGGAADLGDILLQIIGRADVPRQARPELAAVDVLAIVRGMTDTAGERGESDVADLQNRIEPAVFGYLGMRVGRAHA